jgi:pimeloyl-ACP methyl ester carboxylesterase
MATVIANGIKVPYEESGAGEPLVLIHGGQGDRHGYDFFRPLLGDGIRAIAYDQRDTRENPYTGGESYSIRDLAADCAAFISAMGLKKAHILGTSYGGLIAMTTAIHFPERIQSVILGATTPSYKMTEPLTTQATAERDAATIQRFMLLQSITLDAIDNDKLLVAEAMANVRPGPPESVARRMGAARQHDCVDELGRIKAPTLVLHGEEDPLISAKTATFLADHIKGAELKLRPRMRHGFILQERHEIAEIVRAFVLKNAINKAS